MCCMYSGLSDIDGPPKGRWYRCEAQRPATRRRSRWRPAASQAARVASLTHGSRRHSTRATPSALRTILRATDTMTRHRLDILSKCRRVDTSASEEENRDRIHSVHSVTLLGRRRASTVVSRKTVARLSRYRRLLTSLHEQGVTNIYSHELARHAVVSAAQVRRDLMAIGYSGSPSKGYEVELCLDSIGSFLDGSVRQEVALVGVGNLGRAVLQHFAEASPSVAIVAAFDNDPALVGSGVHACRVVDAASMERARPRPGHPDRRSHRARGERPGHRRQPRARRREEHHQLRPGAPSPPRARLRRVHGHHRRARVGGVLRPPRAGETPTRPTRTAAARSDRWSDNSRRSLRGQP